MRELFNQLIEALTDESLGIFLSDDNALTRLCHEGLADDKASDTFNVFLKDEMTFDDLVALLNALHRVSYDQAISKIHWKTHTLFHVAIQHFFADKKDHMVAEFFKAENNYLFLWFEVIAGACHRQYDPAYVKELCDWFISSIRQAKAELIFNCCKHEHKPTMAEGAEGEGEDKRLAIFSSLVETLHHIMLNEALRSPNTLKNIQSFLKVAEAMIDICKEKNQKEIAAELKMVKEEGSIYLLDVIFRSMPYFEDNHVFYYKFFRNWKLPDGYQITSIMSAPKKEHLEQLCKTAIIFQHLEGERDENGHLNLSVWHKLINEYERLVSFRKVRKGFDLTDKDSAKPDQLDQEMSLIVESGTGTLTS